MRPVVVIRPLSGYINRLQAIASSLILAKQLGSDLWVDWEPSKVAPVRMADVLDPGFTERHGRSRHDIAERSGVDPSAIPPYLTFDGAAGIVTLAGLDRGEQAFMPDLRRVIDRHEVHTIVISAGGKFTVEGDTVLSPQQAREFERQRILAYAELPLHPDVEAAAHKAIEGRGSFAALHLRYSDRSLESPWRRQIEPAVRGVTDAATSRSLFIASDTSAERQRWHQRARTMGLEPWSTAPGDYPRSDPRSAWGALVDWRILTRSRVMVYFAASSFAEEAAVASGNVERGVALKATASRRRWMQARQWGQAAITYPQRHGWASRG